MIAEVDAIQSSSARAEAVREASFLDLAPPPVSGLLDRLVDDKGRPFGPALCKLTPWRHHMLLGYASPFVITEMAPIVAGRTQILQALYLCSPALQAGSRWRFRLFLLRWGWLVLRRRRELADAFSDWLDDRFRLMPPMPVESRDSEGRPSADTHWLAGWVRTGRRLFGMSEAEILHLPYDRLWQYLDLETASAADRPRFNRKRDKARGEYLRRLKQQGVTRA